MIKLFTHSDLDGLSCALIALLAFGKEETDYEICSYENINEKLTAYIDEKQYLNYSHCFITDISVNDETAAKINTCINDNPGIINISLFDHHISAEKLNIYKWCRVLTSDIYENKTCGASLFLDALKEMNTPNDSLLYYKVVNSYIEKVRRYDTWDWNELNDICAKQLNDLFYILGKERFIDYWLNRMQNCNEVFDFDDTQLLLLELKQNEIDHYISSRNEELIVKEMAGYKMGILFANRFQSELGNYICQNHPEIDFVAMINIGGGVSCRTVKDDVNLASITSLLGGGGHAKAAGFPVPDEIKELVINKLFNLSGE